MLRWRRGKTLAAGADDRRLLAPENILPGYYRCVPRQWTDEWMHARLSWTAFRKPRVRSWKLISCSQGSYDPLSKREFNLRNGASGNGLQPKRAERHCLRPASGMREAAVGLPVIRNSVVACGVQMNMGTFARLGRDRATSLCWWRLRAELLPVLWPAQDCPRRAFFLVDQISTETRCTTVTNAETQ